MVVELISVGTEILLGNIVNTNAAYLAEKCALLGCSLYHQTVVGDNEERMEEAIRQAKKAAALKEVPIGCVIVHDGKIIARGYNRRTVDKNVLAHAEIIAMRKACRIIGDWRLEDCTMYVTQAAPDPCSTCCMKTDLTTRWRRKSDFAGMNALRC